jgi:hypothetical protein
VFDAPLETSALERIFEMDKKSISLGWVVKYMESLWGSGQGLLLDHHIYWVILLKRSIENNWRLI